MWKERVIFVVDNKVYTGHFMIGRLERIELNKLLQTLNAQ
jgi:hypothetical protein